MIALKEDRPFATYGIPGGRTIPNNQLSLTINLIDLNMTIQQALDRLVYIAKGQNLSKWKM